MVARQLVERGIGNPRVLDALRQVPRHLFVPDEYADRAYDDTPMPIGLGQTISQPYVVALTLELLNPRQTDRVLDVGSGSGYQSALLSRLVAQVYAVERLPELAQRATEALRLIGASNVRIIVGDGTLGLPHEAPFDGIVCGAAAPAAPPAWLDQLAEGGRMVLPIGDADIQTLTVISRHGSSFDKREVCPVRFVKLLGEQGWPIDEY